MLYFNLKPDFKTLSKYFQFPHSVELMEQYYTDGYEIVLDHIYTDEAVAEIEEGYKLIIKRYDLDVHHDNLMFLTLCKIQEIEAILDELYFQYAQKKRTKELAALLLAFTESPLKQYNSLQLKTLKNTAKVTDKNMINWIGKTITRAVANGKMPLNDYEYRIKDAFFDSSTEIPQLNISNLIAESQKTIKFPTSSIKGRYADICFYLYSYLINETTIKPDALTLTSDSLLNFYFDVLVLFGYLKRDEIESEPKDYLGSLLKNRIKSLNPHYQGKKTT